MGRLKGLGSFLWITGVVFLGLRLLHLGIPLLHTGGPTGPVYLDRLESIAGHTQFVPRIPSYWPETLGARPDRIVVTRRPHAGVEIRWAAQRSIRIRERRDGPVPAHPPTAGTFPGYPGSWWWREGRIHRVVLQQDGLWIDVSTDLAMSDLERVLGSLRPL